MIICLGFVSYFLFYAFIFPTLFHYCPLAAAASVYVEQDRDRNRGKKRTRKNLFPIKNAMLLNIIEFRWHLPLWCSMHLAANTQNRLQLYWTTQSLLNVKHDTSIFVCQWSWINTIIESLKMKFSNIEYFNIIKSINIDKPIHYLWIIGDWRFVIDSTCRS